MHETAILHFDLGHLAPDQPFTLRAGSRRYELTPHTRHSLARTRRTDAALGLLPDHRISHFAGPVRLPGNSPLLLRVTAPKLRPDDLLDRLVLTSIHLPRRHRAAGLARRQRRRGRLRTATPCCDAITSPKLKSLGLSDGDLPPDKVIIDIGDWNTAVDAATSLVFHHAELLTTQAAPATDIVCVIHSARGIDDLAESIWEQSQAHENDPSQPNWVKSKVGLDWQNPSDLVHPIYVWSDQTLEYLALPLKDTLQTTKNDPDLQHQCWTVQPGITQLPMTIVPAGSRRVGEPEATYTVREVTPQSGVEHTFSYDPGSGATVSFKNHYLRWLQISVDQYAPGPDGKQIGETQTLGSLAPVDTIMAVPLPPDWSDFPFTFGASASRAVVSLGGLGQGPFDWSYDEFGIIWTSLFNYAIPTLFIALGVAADQGGQAWTGMCKKIAEGFSKLSPFIEAVAEGPLGAAVTTSDPSLTDIMALIGNIAGSLLVGALTDSAFSALRERGGHRIRARGGGAVHRLGRLCDRRSRGPRQHDRDQCRGGAQPGDHGHQHRTDPGRRGNRQSRSGARGPVARHGDALRDLYHLRRRDGALLRRPDERDDAGRPDRAHLFRAAGGREHHRARLLLLRARLAGGARDSGPIACTAEPGQYPGSIGLQHKGEPGPAERYDYLHAEAEARGPLAGPRLARAPGRFTAHRDGVRSRRL
jgi:hypothetical protein